jgi:hypothetical protein
MFSVYSPQCSGGFAPLVSTILDRRAHDRPSRRASPRNIRKEYRQPGCSNVARVETKCMEPTRLSATIHQEHDDKANYLHQPAKRGRKPAAPLQPGERDGYDIDAWIIRRGLTNAQAAGLLGVSSDGMMARVRGHHYHGDLLRIVLRIMDLLDLRDAEIRAGEIVAVARISPRQQAGAPLRLDPLPARQSAKLKRAIVAVRDANDVTR